MGFKIVKPIGSEVTEEELNSRLTNIESQTISTTGDVIVGGTISSSMVDTSSLSASSVTSSNLSYKAYATESLGVLPSPRGVAYVSNNSSYEVARTYSLQQFDRPSIAQNGDTCVVGGFSSAILYSTDSGKTWNTTSSQYGGSGYIHFDGTHFINSGVNSSGYSLNGINWTHVNGYDPAKVSDGYIAATSPFGRLKYRQHATSLDGPWTQSGSLPDYTTRMFYSSVANVTIVQPSSGGTYYTITTRTGSLTARTFPVTSGGADYSKFFEIGNRLFYVDFYYGTIASSTNGINWDMYGSPGFSLNSLTGFWVYNDVYYAMNQNGETKYSSNLSSWTDGEIINTSAINEEIGLNYEYVLPITNARARIMRSADRYLELLEESIS